MSPTTSPGVPMTADSTDRDDQLAPGTPVYAWPGTMDDEPLRTHVRGPVWTLGLGERVVAVVGYAGGISVRHVLPRPGLAHLDATGPARDEGLRAMLAGVCDIYPAGTEHTPRFSVSDVRAWLSHALAASPAPGGDTAPREDGVQATLVGTRDAAIRHAVDLRQRLTQAEAYIDRLVSDAGHMAEDLERAITDRDEAVNVRDALVAGDDDEAVSAAYEEALADGEPWAVEVHHSRAALAARSVPPDTAPREDEFEREVERGALKAVEQAAVMWGFPLVDILNSHGHDRDCDAVAADNATVCDCWWGALKAAAAAMSEIASTATATLAAMPPARPVPPGPAATRDGEAGDRD